MGELRERFFSRGRRRAGWVPFPRRNCRCGSPGMTIVVAAVVVCVPAGAGAVDFDIQGYADFRLVAPSNQVSWMDGGLGKLRFGAENARPTAAFAEAALEGTAVIL